MPSGWAVRAGSAFLVIAALSGCANLNHGTGLTHRNNSNLTVTVPGNSSLPVLYTLQGRTYQGAVAFFEAVQTELAASLDKVTPSPDAPYGTLRIAFPAHTPPKLQNQKNPAGAAEAEASFVRFWELTEKARLKALEKSGLFTTISREAGNVSILGPGTADYALWFEGGIWHIRYRTGNPDVLLNPANVTAWLSLVSAKVKSAKEERPDSFSIHSVNNGKVWFTWSGADYYTVEPMAALMDAEFLRKGRQVQRVPDPLGGKIKVVLATFAAGDTRAKFPNPENAQLVRDANRAYGLATAHGKLEALRHSGLFDTITVETADVSDVPVDGYDYVLWQVGNAPWSWRYRVAGRNDAYSLVVPPKYDTSMFPEIVRDNIRKTKASH
jgi:hypothetical protein